jgi:hypothetical protein
MLSTHSAAATIGEINRPVAGSMDGAVNRLESLTPNRRGVKQLGN